MNKSTRHMQNMVFTGMFSAVLAVLSQIQIPLPSGIPGTLQTYAVALIGFLLGSKYGTAATGIYISLGAAGVPVFSGFSGGAGILLGMSGGFIWGFLFLAAGCGLAVKKTTEEKGVHIIRKKTRMLLGPLAGLMICHFLGVTQFSVVTEMGFAESAMIASVPYLLKDIVSVFVAFITMKAIRKRVDFFLFCA